MNINNNIETGCLNKNTCYYRNDSGENENDSVKLLDLQNGLKCGSAISETGNNNNFKKNDSTAKSEIQQNGLRKTVFVQREILPDKITKGKLLRIISGLFLMFSGVLSFIYTPFEVAMRERARMLPGFPPFDWWLNPPDEAFLKVYLFNITNPFEFINGTDKKIKLQEIGPFTYLERLHHTDVVFNDNGTLTYKAHRTPIFQPHLSANISLDSKLIVPNVAALTGASFLSSFPFFTKIGYNMIMRRLSSKPFIEITADNFMWNYTDPLMGVANKVIPMIVPIDNMGILNKIYSDAVDEVTVYMGPANAKKFFLIDKYNRSPRLGFWPEERCDSVVNATEGVTYPQSISRNDTIRYLRKQICRVATLHYERDVEKLSMDAYRFELPSNVFHRPENPEDDCYTLPGDEPLPSGVADVSPCYYNMPIGISYPHFYGGTEELFSKIDGLNPSKEKHGSYLIVEPVTGVPLESRAGMQCNLVVKSMYGFAKELQPFSESIIPLFWMELSQFSLPWYVISLMYFTVIILPYIQHWLSLIFIVGGVTLVYYGFSSHFSYIYRRFVYRYHKFEKISFGNFKY